VLISVSLQFPTHQGLALTQLDNTNRLLAHQNPGTSASGIGYISPVLPIVKTFIQKNDQ
jgi:hypothetical protein